MSQEVKKEKLCLKSDWPVLKSREFYEPEPRSSFFFMRACLNKHWQYLIYCLLKTGLCWIVYNHALRRKCTVRVSQTAKGNLKDLRVGCLISYNWSWVLMQLDVVVSQDDVDGFDRKIGKDEVFFFIRKKKETCCPIKDSFNITHQILQYSLIFRCTY